MAHILPPELVRQAIKLEWPNGKCLSDTNQQPMIENDPLPCKNIVVFIFGHINYTNSCSRNSDFFFIKTDNKYILKR